MNIDSIVINFSVQVRLLLDSYRSAADFFCAISNFYGHNNRNVA